MNTDRYAASADHEQADNEDAGEQKEEDEPYQGNRALFPGLRLADADGHVDHAHQAHERVEHVPLSTTNGQPLAPRGNENHGHARAISVRFGRSLVAGLALAGACSSGPAEKRAAVGQAAPGPAAPASITEAQVARATISGLFAAPVTFVDGSHDGASFAAGGAARPMAVMMTPLVRLGELDAVTGTDAAVVIASNEGGSGERITLAIVAMRNGTATSVATATVGDRTKVRDVRVAGPEITLDVVEIGAREPACCGTQLATRTYRLEGSTLSQQSSQVTGRLSLAATVAGHTWRLVAIDGTPLATGGAAPTLTFADGRVSGTSGCNEYRGPIAEPAPGTLRIGPAAGTRRTCAGTAADVEARFLKSLSTATRYTFLAGRLVLSGLDGDQMRSVTFDR